MNAKVFRPVRDKFHGDIVGDLDDYYIGDVTGVVMGGPSSQPLRNFPSVVSTEGQAGVPFAQESDVVVQQHDRLLIGSTLYAVRSDRFWTEANSLTGTPVSHYWIEITSTT